METPSQSRVRTPSPKPFKQKKKKHEAYKSFQDYDILGITTSLQTHSIVHLLKIQYFDRIIDLIGGVVGVRPPLRFFGCEVFNRISSPPRTSDSIACCNSSLVVRHRWLLRQQGNDTMVTQPTTSD